MSKVSKFLTLLSVMFLCGSIAFAQQTTVVTKKTEVVQNPDGSYSVIEYPVGKEVIVNLSPMGTVTAGKGMARVIRSSDGTKVVLDVTGVPADTKTYYAYAVDPAGVPTMLGPLTFTDGVAKAEFMTPMNQFMVVLSPNEGLTGIDPTTVVFRSEVPTGYTIVPRRVSTDRVVAVKGVSVSSGYDVPLLNVSTFGESEREMKVKFGGALSGLEAKAYIDRERGVTKVRMHFDDLKKAPKDTRFALWTYSPDGKFTKLGQVVNSGRREEAEIKSETSLTDFGLLVTAEDSEVTVPTSKTFAVFTVSPTP